MNQLNYWAAFGISKKMIVGFILLNVVVFGAIGYFGIKISQQDLNQNLNSSVGITTDSIITENNDNTFWVSTNHVSVMKNGEKVEFTQHILHRRTFNSEVMQYVLFNTITNTYKNQHISLQLIKDGKIYISIYPGDHEVIMVELSIASLPVENQMTFTGILGNVSVIEQIFAEDILQLYKNGVIVMTNRPDTNSTTDLFDFHLNDLNFETYTFPIQGQDFYTKEKNRLGVQTYVPYTQARLREYPLIVSDFSVDENNNLILVGPSKIMTTNLDNYNSENNSTANYINIPQQRRFNLRVKWYDDGNNFYMLYQNTTTIQYGDLKLGDGSVYKGLTETMRTYTIMAVKDFQTNISGEVFTTGLGIAYHSFLTSNCTNFVTSFIVNGRFYGGFTAYAYGYNMYTANELLLVRNRNYDGVYNLTSIFLYSASVNDMLAGTTNNDNVYHNKNFYHIHGVDVMFQYDGQWGENGRLLQMMYRHYNDSYGDTMVFLILQIDKNGNAQYITTEGNYGVSDLND